MRYRVSEIMVVIPWGNQVVGQVWEGNEGFTMGHDEFEVLLEHADGHMT